MNKTYQIGAALGAAALVVAGGSAFTASISGVPAAVTMGQQSTTVTGIIVTDIAYTYNTDFSQIDEVVYTSSSDFTGAEAGWDANLVVTLTGPATQAEACDIDEAVDPADGGTITCTFTPVLAVADVEGFSLSVLPK